jgi:uncharacterized protein YndB with AHSA1/START domain
MIRDAAIDPSKATIQVQYDLPDPPTKVWRALTEPDLLSRWLMPTDIRAEAGHRFTFRSEPRPGWDGIVYCEVLEVIPQERLVYSWRSGSSGQEGGHELNTIITWTLVPTSQGGTRLLLEHSGFEPEAFAFKAMSQGWSGKIAGRMSGVLASM